MYHETECGYEHHSHGGRPEMGHGEEWGHHGHGGWGGMHHGPHFGPFGHRRFISKEEVITQLEEYLKQLKAEAAGVEERIAELKKKQT